MVDSFLSGNEILAGGHIPRSVSDHLSLAALSEGVSRANIIKMLIIKYLQDKPTNIMMETLASSAFETWKRKRRKKTFAMFMSYLEKNVRPSLERRRVSEEHIVQILKKIGDLNATHEKHGKYKTK